VPREQTASRFGRGKGEGWVRAHRGAATVPEGKPRLEQDQVRGAYGCLQPRPGGVRKAGCEACRRGMVANRCSREGTGNEPGLQPGLSYILGDAQTLVPSSHPDKVNSPSGDNMHYARSLKYRPMSATVLCLWQRAPGTPAGPAIGVSGQRLQIPCRRYEVTNLDTLQGILWSCFVYPFFMGRALGGAYNRCAAERPNDHPGGCAQGRNVVQSSFQLRGRQLFYNAPA